MFGFQPKPYFAFGSQVKTSLISHFCRQNNYAHLKNPSFQQFMNVSNQNTIMQGSLQLFYAIESKVPSLQVIFFGKNIENQQLFKIRNQYCSIGKCKRVYDLNEDCFRKQMYSNLIFCYGPNPSQIQAASQTLAKNIGYTYTHIPPNANTIIQKFNKSTDFVINGLFLQVEDIQVLEKYFTVRIIHIQHHIEDHPELQEFFNKQTTVLKYLKNKSFYHCFNGTEDPVKIMDDIGIALCPQLIFVNRTEIQQLNYIKKYINQADGLLLGIMDIIFTKKRKNLPLTTTSEQRCNMLTEIIFKDLSRKQIVMTDFPFQTNEFIYFQNMNRKFKCYVDLTKMYQFDYSYEYSSSIYFLEDQRRTVPHQNNPLQQQLKQFSMKIKYWIINGPPGSGKSTVSKYIASQFGYKLIEFQPFLASLKQKLLTPQDGQQLPLKKICSHVSKMLNQNSQSVYVFDGFPYEGNDLVTWLKIVGAPNVLNLRVEQDTQIRRSRKKAEGDVNAQISEQQAAKAKQMTEKNTDWITKVSEQSISSQVFQIDYNMPQLLGEQVINSILRPRVFLIQRHQSLLYQNLALKYNMRFINLFRNNLRSILPIVKKSQQRDIILCYYAQQDERLISDDLYWIQKNVGPIRYLGIWGDQNKQIKEQMIHLQRPPKEQKPKKAQGQQGEDQPPAEQQQGEQEGKKKQLDIYQFEWSNPTCHKNLSQWFFKLKNKIIERNNSISECYRKFDQVLMVLKQNRRNVVYEKIHG